jgi:lipoprotein-releasing system permease protein
MADKISSFPVLTQLGMLPNQISSVFFVLGISVSFIGALLGLLLGTLVVLIQQWSGVIEIATAMPYPVELAFSNMILVLLTLVILGSGVSYLSSRSLPLPSKAIEP